MKIIDAENQILGRLASEIAKDVLNGEKVIVVNAEKAVISGNPKYIVEIYKEKMQRGDPYKGPFFPRMPDMILKRAVRGMLPIKKPRGREAFKNLMVFISVPEEFKDKEMEKYKKTENKLKSKFITLGKLSENLGTKKTW